MKNYLIIDGMNLAYRAHSIFFDARTASGVPSGMFYGFLKMLLSIRNKYRGYKFVVAWDNRSEWKYQLFPGYKADRSTLSSRVFDQVDSLKKFLTCCNIDQYEKRGEEADDIIASIVESFKNSCQGHIIIYTNDKDMLQLVTVGKVTVIRPKVGITPEKIYDYDEVKKEFGVSPERLPEYRALDGDTSDTIPGVPRVPRTILASLVNSSQNLEDIFDSSLKGITLTEFRRVSIEGFKDQFAINYKIMKLRRDLEDMDLTPGGIDDKEMDRLLKEYEVKSLDANTFKSLFEEELMLKYTTPVKPAVIESVSLFD
jgi:DNA polymerase-1